MFYPYEGYRSVTPLDAARVNRTVFLFSVSRFVFEVNVFACWRALLFTSNVPLWPWLMVACVSLAYNTCYRC